MKTDLTNGSVLKNLLKFTLPIMLACFLQVAYGAVDLLVVGHFGSKADMSGVSTGAQLMHSLTMVVTCFGTGATVFIGKKIGEGNIKDANRTIGNSVVIFLVFAIILTILLELVAVPFCKVMHAPLEAFNETLTYVRICCAGFILITFYNLLGSICRGLGDSKTPLITVIISAFLNVILDLVLCAIFNLGTKGVAFATIISQGISVVITYFMLKKNKNLKIDFTIRKETLKLRKDIVKGVIVLGAPLAIQEFLVGASFLVVMSVVNNLGLDSSAALGVAQKVIGFLLLAPSSFMQSISAFTAQNIGARKIDRTNKALRYGIMCSLIFACFLFVAGFFFGSNLSSIFSSDNTVNELAGLYLKAFAFDTFLTSFLFCLMGYLNGRGKTKFVLAQSVFGAFCIRIPMCIILSKLPSTNLFYIGLATPSSSLVQIIITLIFLAFLLRKDKKNKQFI